MEVWKDINGYEGLYQVSDNGQVRSIPKRVWNRYKYDIRKTVILKQKTSSLYKQISLCKNGKAKSVNVHRLIAKAFISNPENKLEVNHKNGIKQDNNIENLEWCTRKENSIHAVKTGLQKIKIGSDHHCSILKEHNIINIRNLFDKKIINRAQISRLYPQMTYSGIRMITDRKNWKHVM